MCVGGQIDALSDKKKVHVKKKSTRKKKICSSSRCPARCPSTTYVLNADCTSMNHRNRSPELHCRGHLVKVRRALVLDHAARPGGGGGRASLNDPHGRGGPNGPTHSPNNTVKVSVGTPVHDPFFDPYMSLVKCSVLCVSLVVRVFARGGQESVDSENQWRAGAKFSECLSSGNVRHAK
jgi:hypothetical protein